MQRNGGLIGGRVDPTFAVASGVYTLDDAAYYESQDEWPGEAEDWVRPAEWLALPDISGQQRFVGLYPISYDGNFLALSAAGDYTVDWGDGTTTNHATGTVAYKEYNYADIPDTGEATLGYRQVIVSVTPQAGNDLTAFSLQHRHNQTGLNTVYSPQWLDVRLNGSALTSFSIGGSIALRSLQAADVAVSQGVTSLASVFQDCSDLRVVSISGTSGALAANSMFRGCSMLRRVPLFDTSSVTNMDSMFRDCVNLLTVPKFNTSAATNMTFMFHTCSQLRKLPLLDTSSVTNLQFFLGQCPRIQEIPFFNTSKVQNFQNLFQNCTNLKSVPLLDMSEATSAFSMFGGCGKITAVPLFVFPKLTNMYGMFYTLSSVTEFPVFDTAHVTGMDSLFYGTGIYEIPPINTSSVVNMDSFARSCPRLQSIPLLDFSSVQSMHEAFRSCNSLKRVPQLNTSSVVNMAFSFSNCQSLAYMPPLDVSAATNLQGALAGGGNLARFDCVGLNATATFANCKFSRLELQRIFANLARRTASTTITISGNYGAAAAVSKASCGTTAGSTTITQADTSNLAVGMRVTGTGFDAAAAVTMQDTGDTVTRVAHGIANGTKVAFATIVTTTGILTNTIYYVVNATADTFQLAATPGGAAIELTGDGSGTLRIPAYITSISDNVSVTVSAPAVSTGTATLAFRVLDTFDAIAKGWTVSG